jgi:hypothetical protein
MVAGEFCQVPAFLFVDIRQDSPAENSSVFGGFAALGLCRRR